MKEAIEKATLGGWKPNEFALEHWKKIMPNLHRIDQWRICSYALLDPFFWKSLGNVLNWKTESGSNMNHEWVLQWHSFIDHLASGRDVDSFFAELLTNK